MAAGRSSDYTSLSALGASQPLTPMTSNAPQCFESGSGSGSSWSSTSRHWGDVLLRNPLRTLAFIAKELLPPQDNDEEEYDDEIDADRDQQRQHRITTAKANAQTPLLAEFRRRARLGSVRRSGTYVGGGCVCAPFDNTAADGSDVQWPAACRECHSPPMLSLAPPSQQNTFKQSDTGTDRGKTPSSATLAVCAQTCFAVLSLLSAKLGNALQIASNYKDNTPSHIRPSLDAVHFLAWHACALMLCTGIVLLASGKRDFVFGPRGARVWHWTRAACSAVAGTTFIVAAQGISTCELVVIVFLAPALYNITSNVFFTTRHPFRAQLIAVSLWLGLILLVQPEALQSQTGDFWLLLKLRGKRTDDQDVITDEETTAASPIDLVPLINTSLLVVRTSWAYAAAVCSGLFTMFSFALLDRAPVGRRVRSGHQSLFSASALTLLAAIAIHSHLTPAQQQQGRAKSQELFDFRLLFRQLRTLFANSTNVLLFTSIVILSYVGRILQDAALLGRRREPRLPLQKTFGASQMGLLGFVQPLLSTGIPTIMDEGDLLSLSGCLLIIVNL